MSGARYIAVLVAAMAILVQPRASRAHGLAPALLEVVEEPATGHGKSREGGQSYQVTWTSRASSAGELAIRWPAGCSVPGPVRRSYRDKSAIERFELVCQPPGLAGAQGGSVITIAGLGNALIDALVRISWQDGHTSSAVLDAGEPSLTLSERPVEPEAILGSYVSLGVEHILLGPDHLLFVLGLVLLVRRRKALVIAISAFTLGHSVTLSAAALGVVDAPSAPIEAIIALSIVFLAREIVALHGAGSAGGTGEPRGATGPSLTQRAPWLVAASFGLLHGFGFAGALAETGLPPGDIPVALLSFNVGVELGQIAFVLATLAVLRCARAFVGNTVTPALIAGHAMGALACFWCIQRLAELG